MVRFFLSRRAAAFFGTNPWPHLAPWIALPFLALLSLPLRARAMTSPQCKEPRPSRLREPGFIMPGVYAGLCLSSIF